MTLERGAPGDIYPSYATALVQHDKLQTRLAWQSNVGLRYTGWRKKTGPPYLIANILKIS